MAPLFTLQSMKAWAPRSLVWRGDALIDWVGGGAVWTLDGRAQAATINYAYSRFDAACTSTDGRTVVIYERLGTKALLLRDGHLQRELNRSYYSADDYEYPITLLDAPDGRLLLAHCPDAYNRLDIEDALTGERLTAHRARKLQDYFYSRLTANPSGTRLMSAGWVWQPWDVVQIFDVAAALADPRLLDREEATISGRDVGAVEQSSAAWQTDERIILGGGEGEADPDHIGPQLEPEGGVAIYDVVVHRCVTAASLGRPVGTLMPVGDRHAVSFFEHPKLFELATGRILHAWQELATGDQVRSILHGAPPPLAIDRQHARFAVADAEKITVVSVNLAAL